MMPAQRKASHGSSGWVPLTNTLNTSPRGEPDGGDSSHEVRWPSNARSVAHHSIPAPASAAAMPIVAIHGVASVKMAADTANMAP